MILQISLNIPRILLILKLYFKLLNLGTFQERVQISRFLGQDNE